MLELVEAARGLPLVVAGDGPLRDRVPDALGFVPHDEVLRLIERAAVVASPVAARGVRRRRARRRWRTAGRSSRSAVGGLLDLVVDGETGLLVPPRDAAALRAALERAARRRGAPRPPRRGGAGAGAGALRLAGRHRRDAGRVRAGTTVRAMLKALFWGSAAGIAWTHAGYPPPRARPRACARGRCARAASCRA